MITLILGATLAIMTTLIIPVFTAHNDFYRGKNVLNGRYDAALLTAITAATSLAVIGWKGLVNLALLMDFNQPGEPQGVAVFAIMIFFFSIRTLAGKLYNRQWEKVREEKVRRKRELETRKSIKVYQQRAFAEQQAQRQLKKLPCANARQHRLPVRPV